MTENFATSTLSPALRQAAHAVDVPEDPWPGFARRERRHQRTRLVRTAVAAAVGVVLVGVQTNVVPLPGWAPGIAVAAAPTALLDGPPRGAGRGSGLVGCPAGTHRHAVERLEPGRHLEGRRP
ncbi:hypothetical protein NKG94_45490 [Micromonospora sp. M12]